LKLTNRTDDTRLSATTLGTGLAYDRSKVSPGIVHLGVGAFQRAHMAVYVDDILGVGPSWGIIGASLRRPDTRLALAPQDFLYTLAVQSGAGTTIRTIGALLNVLDATVQHAQLISALTDPRIRIVTLTITEKGYCHDPATGLLDQQHPDVLHDLARPEEPVSAPGLIVRALELRKIAGVAPFTVLCCDNLPANGQTTARVVTGLAELRDRKLANYIAREVAFPSTMVDRIVPATTDVDRKLVFEATGMTDAWPVVTEPFSQWVVEDHFPFGRPPLEKAGVQFVSDVRPYELMKLRMLNGSHSILAYLGYLGGYKYVNEAIADPAFRRLIHDFMTQEVMETLPPGLSDLVAYRDALLERFDNPALQHQTWQIAMDGSQKLPQRLLGTIRERLERGLSVTRAALGVAAWMRYVSGTDEQGGKTDVRDPLAARLATITKAAGATPLRLVEVLLNVREVFGDDLPRHNLFRAELVRHLTSLFQIGARGTARALIGERP